MTPALALAALTLAQPPAVPNPDWVCRVVLGHKTAAVNAAVARGLTREAAEYDVSHWYYLSWHGWPADRLPATKRFGQWWLNNLHFAADAVEFREVEGSGGLVWWFDRREPDWSADAVSAVFRRDVVFRQPAMTQEVAALLRASVGRMVDSKTLHCEAVAWAPRILRDTLESQRSPSYYDLLFSRQRFGSAPAPKEHPDPKWRGWYTVDGGASYHRPEQLPKAKTDPNFPATLDDWEGLFKRESKAIATAFGKPVQIANLAVVAGYKDDPAKGSVVSAAGRAVEIVQGDHGPVMKTLDVKEQAGERNLLEFAPRMARGERPRVDASETLAALPAGGQAAALWDGAGKRVEIADGNIARGVQKPVSPAHANAQHPNVRNPVDCCRCHGPSFGVIEPRDLVKDVFDAGADLKFADPADVIRFRGAYGRLKETIPGHQARYRSLIERTTTAAGKPWAPKELVDALEGFVHTYDSAVTKEQAAAELGVAVAVLERVGRATLTAQPKALIAAKGSIPCPRPAWDADVRPALLDVLVSEYPGGMYGGKP